MLRERVIFFGMLLKTRGIIFRTIKYSETSIIADIFTEEKGLNSFIISGVRNPKSKVGSGLFQVMSLVDLVAYFKEDGKLNRIKEVRPAHVYQSIPFQIEKMAVGMFMAEVCQKSIKTAEENQQFFKFLMDSFMLLDETKNSVANYHLTFMMGLTHFLGFLPNGKYSTQTPYFDLKEGTFEEVVPIHPNFLNQEDSKYFGVILKANLAEAHFIKLSREERRTLLNNLLNFFKYHIDDFGEVQTHKIFETVLS